MPLLLGGEAQKGAHGRHLARGRGCPKSLGPAAGEKAAKVDRIKCEQACRADGFAAMLGEKVEQAMRRGDISPGGMRAAPAIEPKLRIEARREGARLLA